MNTKLLLLLISIFVIKTAAAQTTTQTYPIENLPKIGKYKGATFYEGGFSGLYYLPNTEYEFLIITDRGPNIPAEKHGIANGKKAKIFPFENYAPKIFKAKLENGKCVITKSHAYLRPDGQKATGLPLPQDRSKNEEVGWLNRKGKPTGTDIWGADSEGITVDKEGNIWICEEYGASIWKLNSDFKTQVRYTPYPKDEGIELQLDKIIGKQRPNRGFEGITATPNGKIYAIMQSPMYTTKDTETLKKSRLHRILELDPQTGKQVTYIFENPGKMGEIRQRDWKVGDITAINDTEFLVLVHGKRNGESYKSINKVSITNATPLHGGEKVELLRSAEKLEEYGIKVVENEVLFNLKDIGWNPNHEKPEGIAILNKNTIALINDNDYGMESKKEDGKFEMTGVKSTLYIITLETPLW